MGLNAFGKGWIRKFPKFLKVGGWGWILNIIGVLGCLGNRGWLWRCIAAKSEAFWGPGETLRCPGETKVKQNAVWNEKFRAAKKKKTLAMKMRLLALSTCLFLFVVGRGRVQK